MNSATFLLAINFSIGISFGVAFLSLAWKADLPLGRWCAFGFFSASFTTVIESLAQVIPFARLVSALSFSSLLLALTLIVVGLARHFTDKRFVALLVAWWLVWSLVNAAVTFHLKRGAWAQGVGYQLPFAATLLAGIWVIMRGAPKRGAAVALAIVFGLSAVQFLFKAVLSALAGDGPGVDSYIFSKFAFYSQTVGGILSILLGLCLVGLIVGEVMERTRSQYELDHLSGVLTRGAFLARASVALSKAGTAIVVLCDLDHFKMINDRFGHAAGDEVIQTFGRNLQHYLKNAYCGRLGGEEFCVLITETSLETVIAKIGALQVLLRQTRYELVPADRIVTASFGIAIREPGEPLSEMLRRSDIALYAAKGMGRACYAIAPGAANDVTSQEPTISVSRSQERSRPSRLT